MKYAAIAACSLLSLVSTPLLARGVSPYLPLNLDPTIERQIERALILADKPVLTRPFAAAAVLDALPAACAVDKELCQDVRRYLARYMRNFSVTDAGVAVAASSGSDKTLPNSYGMTNESAWQVYARGFWQPSDYALVSLGAVAYDNEVVPEGSMISVGWERAQLDIGYRARWLSPMTDSAMLSSTQAATMPSVTLSNYTPLTRWGIHYEAFMAAMSRSNTIEFAGQQQSGRPRLAGVHLSAEPTSGWALGFNRILQYGGGERPSSTGDLFRAFFSPSRYDNTNPNLTSDEQFGNQLASITSTLIFPGRVPFSIYFEYAGEDTSAGKNYLLGNSALSAGIHFPRLWRRFDVTYEVSEWQNLWYVNSVYGDGLTNKGHVIGHWGGDERLFGDAVGAQTHMLRVGWDPAFGGSFDVRVRTIANESYSGAGYRRGYDGTVSYAIPFKGFTVGAEAYAGRDVFGEDFSRVGAFFRYDPSAGFAGSFGESTEEPNGDPTAELFVEAGAAYNRLRTDLDATGATTESKSGMHFGLGARRAVSDRSDLGARIEIDDVDGNTLLSVRALDYRYRFRNPLALSVFIGASRYDVATPAYGLYYGAGVQWRDIVKGWDVGVDLRNAKKVARDHLLPDDPSSALRPDSFYTVESLSLSLTKRF